MTEVTWTWTDPYAYTNPERSYTCEVDDETGLAKLPEGYFFKVTKGKTIDTVKVKLMCRGKLFTWMVGDKWNVVPDAEKIQFAAAKLRMDYEAEIDANGEQQKRIAAIPQFLGSYPPKKI